jgi:hypothetical protein
VVATEVAAVPKQRAELAALEVVAAVTAKPVARSLVGVAIAKTALSVVAESAEPTVAPRVADLVPQTSAVAAEARVDTTAAAVAKRATLPTEAVEVAGVDLVTSVAPIRSARKLVDQTQPTQKMWTISGMLAQAVLARRQLGLVGRLAVQVW